MPYIEKLKQIKKTIHMTNEETAERGGLPLSTVTRVLNNQTTNPTFETMVGFAKAWQFSLDDLAGIGIPESTLASAQIEKLDSRYAALLAERNERIKEAERQRERERKEKICFALFAGTLASLIIIFLLVDLCNGHFGYFRY